MLSFCALFAILGAVPSQSASAFKPYTDIGWGLTIGKSYDVSGDWNELSSIPYLLGAQKVIPKGTELIPGDRLSGGHINGALLVRRYVAPHWHIQPQIGATFDNIRTASDPVGDVSLFWQTLNFSVGAMAGVNTQKSDWQSSARIGGSILFLVEDSLYLNVGNESVGIFTDRDPQKVGFRLESEGAMKYKKVELSLRAYRDFLDINGSGDGLAVNVLGAGLSFRYFFL